MKWSFALHAEPSLHPLSLALEAETLAELLHDQSHRAASEYAHGHPELEAVLAGNVSHQEYVRQGLDIVFAESGPGVPLQPTVWTIAPTASVVLVNDIITLRQFIEACEGESNTKSSEQHAGRVCGIDCEWRDPRPISLVQVAFPDDAKVCKVFLLDFVDNKALTPTAEVLAALLAETDVRCEFSDRNFHSRIPSVPTHLLA
jgi:hypothetical protein